VSDIVHVPFGDAGALEATIRKLGPDNVAAVIVEPIQAEAGVIVPSEGYLHALGDLCRAHGILVIADEIQVGLGRAGHWFESLAQGLEPDILTLGKHLSGGLTPIGVTITRRELARRALAGLDCDRIASTFAGNALSAAVALKSLELLVEQNLPQRSQRLGAAGLRRLRVIQGEHPDLLEAVRGAGLLYALQLWPVISLEALKRHQELISQFSGVLALGALHQAGIEACLSLANRSVVRLTPPLTIPAGLFTSMWDRLDRAADVNDPAWHMILHTHLHTLLGLAELARMH
jgi:acetylornithine/succinyldiaminopimelate/putrescine aminotransferase